MAEITDVAEFGPWKQAPWNPSLILPQKWAEDVLDPVERGPYAAITASNAAIARHVMELLNEDAEAWRNG